MPKYARFGSSGKSNNFNKTIMSNNVKSTYAEWRAGLRSRTESAAVKQASALKAEDCTDKGTVTTPSYNTEANRSNLNMPTNPTANTVQTKDGVQGLCNVTKPNGVGEGEYPTTVNGNAKDEAFKTPSTPLSKIAGDLANSAASTVATPAPAAKETPAPAEKSANTDSFELPADLKADASIMQKLAYCGGLALSTKEGQAFVAGMMAKEAGRAEAQSILNEVAETMAKEAAANQQAVIMQQEAMQKQAAFNHDVMVKQAAHAGWLNSFEHDFEKVAYMTGAADGDAMASAAEAGQEAGIPEDMSQLSDEEVLAAIQQLQESGAVTPEQVSAFMQRVTGDQAQSYTAADLAAMIQEDLDNGTLDEATAEQLAAEILAKVEAGEIPSGVEGTPAAAPEEAAAAMADPSMMEVQASMKAAADAVSGNC